MDRAKLAATATYLSLTVFYVGSLLITVSVIGSDNLGAALSFPAYAWSVLSRLLGGIACIAIVSILYSHSPRRTLAEVLAWGLVVGVTGNLLLDVGTIGPTSALMWLIAFAMVAVHVWGATCTRRAFREVSTH
jgi:hypothetical protein